MGEVVFEMSFVDPNNLTEWFDRASMYWWDPQPVSKKYINMTARFVHHLCMRIFTTLYALVICNNSPPPPTHQVRGRARESRGNERGFGQSFATAVRGKYSGFALYRQKRSVK